MTSPRPSRRDFLTGRAVVKELRQRGEDLADALAEAIPRAGDTVRLEARAMGCQWAVVLNPGPPRQVMCGSDALDLVARCEDLLTIYRDDSFIARVNREAAQTAIPLPPELIPFFRTCRDWWTGTDGAFDIAAGSLIQLWKRARQLGNIPSTGEIEEALARAGSQHVQLDEKTGTIAFDRPGVLLDFGAVGKGYAVDLAADHLRREEVSDCLVHGGYSSLYARGSHAGHDGWPVGVRNPLVEGAAYATVLLKDQGLATSGSNVQYFRHEGRRYGHILDPRSGWPASGLLSATVIAPTAAAADALSTALYVMGLDKAIRYCEDHPEIGAILVPPPARGRVLEPVVRNIPADRLFWENRTAPDPEIDPPGKATPDSPL